MNPVTSAFDPLLGSPSWLVRRGHGSFVTLEFGTPTLSVQEPREQTITPTASGPIEVMARLTALHGEWHLWIYCCRWSLASGRSQLADSDSDDDAITAALRILDGQALGRVGIDHTDGSTRFEFDLGCVLTTRPNLGGTGAPDELWMLYQPTGKVLTVRSDGRFAQISAHQPDDRITWEQIPPTDA